MDDSPLCQDKGIVDGGENNDISTRRLELIVAGHETRKMSLNTASEGGLGLRQRWWISSGIDCLYPEGDAAAAL